MAEFDPQNFNHTHDLPQSDQDQPHCFHHFDYCNHLTILHYQYFPPTKMQLIHLSNHLNNYFLLPTDGVRNCLVLVPRQ